MQTILAYTYKKFRKKVFSKNFKNNFLKHPACAAKRLQNNNDKTLPNSLVSTSYHLSASKTCNGREHQRHLTHLISTDESENLRSELYAKVRASRQSDRNWKRRAKQPIRRLLSPTRAQGRNCLWRHIKKSTLNLLRFSLLFR